MADGVQRVGKWAVVDRGDELVALSPRCRHQLADLSEGAVEDGCLVCPWHGASYDLDSGRMVRGPQGFLAIRHHLPGYDALIKAYAVFLPLRRRAAHRQGGEIVVDDS